MRTFRSVADVWRAHERGQDDPDRRIQPWLVTIAAHNGSTSEISGQVNMTPARGGAVSRM